MQVLQGETQLSRVFKELLPDEQVEGTIRCKGLRRWRGGKVIIKEHSFNVWQEGLWSWGVSEIAAVLQSNAAGIFGGSCLSFTPFP